MATQIVMDHTGDTQHTFDATDAKFLVNADSGPYRPDEDDEPDTVVTVQPK